MLARKAGLKNSLLTAAAVIAFAIVPVLFIRGLPHPPYTVRSYSSIDWKKLIQGAQREVRAEGTVLDGIDIDDLTKSLTEPRARKLNVKLVLLDPEGQAVEQRMRDEGPTGHDNRFHIREKIRSFQFAQTSAGSDLWKDRFRLVVRDTYPTMAVIVVDDDLYAYFYALRKKGTESPVLQFSNYRNSGSLATLFEDHLTDSSDEKQGAHEPKNYTTGPITN